MHRQGRDLTRSIVVELQPIVMNGVKVIDTYHEVGRHDRLSGLSVEHEDDDGFGRLRAECAQERGGKDEGQEGAGGRGRGASEPAFGRNIVLLCHASRRFRKWLGMGGFC